MNRLDPAPTIESVRAAATRLAGVIHRTPLVSSHTLSSLTGTDLRFKPENLQITGSFKVRGAFNKISRLARQSAAGVVTASSGNHGQAVAWAARYYGLPAHIVVPTTAPRAKVEAAAAYGAEVEYWGTTSTERLDRAYQVARSSGRLFVPPFDDADVIAGQGTIGLEILEDFPDVEVILCPIGGGGLVSGVATAIKETAPHVRIIGVEPEGAAKATAALAEGRHLSIPESDSIADGLKTLALGTLNYSVITRYVDDVVTVSDGAIAETLWMLLARTKLLVEPSGAAAAAYALTAPYPLAGRRVAVVLSGGNVDPDALVRVLN